MPYRVLEIYRDLPRTNCGDCGRPGCFPFASAAYLEGLALSACPHLPPDAIRTMAEKLAAGRERGEGRRPESSEQALRALLTRIADDDFPELARRSGARHLPGPAEALEVELMGVPCRIRRDDVEALRGPPLTTAAKILLLIYVTRADGSAPRGEWVAFRELPNTSSKAKSFDREVETIGRAFEGRLEDLDAAVRRAGGSPTGSDSADRAWDIRALPRVPLLLLYWTAQDDFPARASLLVDRGLLCYLDQEASLFVAESLAGRLAAEAQPRH